MRILPDGFTGAIMAVESICDARAILHGPGGCRNRHMSHITSVFPRMESSGTSNYNLPFFYGNPRVPCTYLDEYDYINGAYYKVSEILPIVNSKDCKLIAIINSPGAALIGDNHEKAIAEAGLNSKALYIDENLISTPLTFGYDHTLRSILEWLKPEKKTTIPNSVNILGLSILDKDWFNALCEIKKSLNLMGLTVISSPGAGASIDELRNSVNAQYNIIVSPEFCIDTAKYYKESYDIPYILSDQGAPVGFTATSSWLKNISLVTQMDSSHAEQRLNTYMNRAFQILIGTGTKSMKLRGMSFSICGLSSIIYPLTKWLYEDLSMAPVAVLSDVGSFQTYEKSLFDFLLASGNEASWSNYPPEYSDVVICEGGTSQLMKLRGQCAISIDIGIPSYDLDNFISRPIVGARGAMSILDDLMVGIRTI